MNDAKSSAGDKHETSRAMMQIEQEKAAKQLNEALEMKQMLEKINTYTQSKSVGVGSFIKTNIGYFYIAVPIGKLNIFNQDVFVISAKSPLGAKLIGLKSHDSIDINAKKVNIEFVN
jgi:transcription elongation GreA/GreB family factor